MLRNGAREYHKKRFIINVTDTTILPSLSWRPQISGLSYLEIPMWVYRAPLSWPNRKQLVHTSTNTWIREAIPIPAKHNRLECFLMLTKGRESFVSWGTISCVSPSSRGAALEGPRRLNQGLQFQIRTAKGGVRSCCHWTKPRTWNEKRTRIRHNSFKNNRQI